MTFTKKRLLVLGAGTAGTMTVTACAAASTRRTGRSRS